MSSEKQTGLLTEGHVCSLEDCTGCLLCKVICPKSAISIGYDDCLHVIPQINTSKCIKCNKCVNICPSINPIPFNNLQNFVYASWNKNKRERFLSASGGLSYILSKSFVELGGYFVGCESSSASVKHSICNKVGELKKYQGSKYVQSNIEDIFASIKQLLESGKKVLFSGTPCQVSAVKAFLGNNYENFYSIDLVCHGVPSPLLRKQWMKIKSLEAGKEVVNMKFRVKNPDQYCTAIQYIYNDGATSIVPLPEDIYFLSFVYNYTLRKSCYNCKYSQIKRVGDITLADFWGYLPHSLRYSSYRKGTSMLLVNSAKGELLKSIINNKVIYDKRNIEDAIKGNLNLRKPQPMPNNHSFFWDKIHEDGFQSISKEFFPVFHMSETTTIGRVVDFARILLPEEIIKSLKSIIRKIKR